MRWGRCGSILDLGEGRPVKRTFEEGLGPCSRQNRGDSRWNQLKLGLGSLLPCIPHPACPTPTGPVPHFGVVKRKASVPYRQAFRCLKPGWHPLRVLTPRPEPPPHSSRTTHSSCSRHSSGTSFIQVYAAERWP